MFVQPIAQNKERVASKHIFEDRGRLNKMRTLVYNNNNYAFMQNDLRYLLLKKDIINRSN